MLSLKKLIKTCQVHIDDDPWYGILIVMKSLLLPILIFLSSSTVVFAQSQVITLNDGSQVKGELVSVNDGTYTVRTSAMGDVKVKSTQIKSITTGSAAPADNNLIPSFNANNPYKAKMQAVQNSVLADPALMQEIQTLTQDPQLAPLLADPALMQAATSQDPQAIAGNPKAQELMQNPKMRALIEKIATSQQTQ